MRFTKFVAPVLSTLALLAGAVAIADDPSGDGSSGSTVTICVIGSADALGSTCIIAVDGEPLAGAYIAPGANLIVVPALPAGALTVDGDEVVGRSLLEDGAGLN